MHTYIYIYIHTSGFKSKILLLLISRKNSLLLLISFNPNLKLSLKILYTKTKKKNYPQQFPGWALPITGSLEPIWNPHFETDDWAAQREKKRMASGWGISMNKGRCYDFWIDFSECMSRCREPKDCTLLREDYFECLHHSKEVHPFPKSNVSSLCLTVYSSRALDQ